MDIVANSAIGTLPIGEDRIFEIRLNTGQVIRVELKSGALLMMQAETQSGATHAVLVKQGSNKMRFSLNCRLLKVREKLRGIPQIGGEQKKKKVREVERERREESGLG